MKTLFKMLLAALVVAVVAGVVASFLARKRLAAMSDDEIREFVSSKLVGRVGQEQLETIQHATVAGIRKIRKPSKPV